jgi:MerR family transcriptional regulator, copper efflux regulator
VAMTGGGSDSGALVPIDQLARRFGIRASALRYYEEIGLLTPASRHSGRRWYGPDEVRRVAVIPYWQESGLMGLDEIAEMVAGPTSSRRWRQVLEGRVESLSAQIEKMEEARSFLEHVIAHHHYAPDGCPYYETLLRGTGPGHDHGSTSHHSAGGQMPTHEPGHMTRTARAHPGTE